MKKTFLLSFFALLLICNHAFAVTVIIDGCTRHKTYSRVEIKWDNLVICSGNGSLVCPLAWATVDGVSKGSCTLEEVICWVCEKADRGISSSEGEFYNDIPVKWQVLKDNNILVEIDGKVSEN